MAPRNVGAPAATVRRLMRTLRRRHPEALLYLGAAVTYVVAGIWQKALLNWIVGPLWLVAFVELVPRLGHAIGARRRRPAPPGGVP
jgi:hypothetical protein